MIRAVMAAVYLSVVTIFGEPVEMETMRCTYYLPTGHCTADWDEMDEKERKEGT